MSLFLRLALALASLHLSHATCSDFPIRLPGEILTLNSEEPSCPSEAERETMRRRLDDELDRMIEAQLPVFQKLSFPVECGGEGWIKVADFNLERDSGAQCPGQQWVKLAPGDGVPPHCRNSATQSCQSANFLTNSIQYSEVCGRVKGYQIGRTNGFYPYSLESSIDELYLDGVSITRRAPGEPREHVWSFAAGGEFRSEAKCPCSDNSTSVPPEVGQNYFCNVGTPGSSEFSTLYPNNPLWDGEGCVQDIGCCSRGPYFHVNLEKRSCDPLEVRLCTLGSHEANNVGMSIIELYVK